MNFRRSSIVAVALVSSACFAETVVQNLNWTLCEYASIDGDVLTVDVPESETNRNFMCSATLDLTPFANRELHIRGVVSGENVRNGTDIAYCGSKFMLVYTNLRDGSTIHAESSRPSGTFTNLEYKLVDFSTCYGQRSDTGLLRFGFQNGCGRYSLDLSTLTFSAEDPFYPITNQNYVVSYSPRIRVAEPLHGVMSPSRAMTEDDFATLAEWGAKLLRYQMVGVPAFSPDA